MTVQHQNFVDLATRLIAKHGRAMDLVSHVKTGPSYDPQISSVSTRVIGVQVSFSEKEKSSGLVLEKDIKVLIDSTVKPTVDMRLLDSDVSYSVVGKPTELKPGASSILYKVHART